MYSLYVIKQSDFSWSLNVEILFVKLRKMVFTEGRFPYFMYKVNDVIRRHFSKIFYVIFIFNALFELQLSLTDLSESQFYTAFI